MSRGIGRRYGMSPVREILVWAPPGIFSRHAVRFSEDWAVVPKNERGIDEEVTN